MEIYVPSATSSLPKLLWLSNQENHFVLSELGEVWSSDFPTRAFLKITFKTIEITDNQ